MEPLTIKGEDCRFPLELPHRVLVRVHRYFVAFPACVLKRRPLDRGGWPAVGQFQMLQLKRLFRNFTSSAVGARELKPSIFTGKADFYETLYFLDDVVLTTKDIKQIAQTIEFNWLNRENLQNKLGFEMSLLEYRQIRQRLSKIQNAAVLSPNVFEFLRVFGEAVRTDADASLLSSEHSQLELKKESSLGWIDELGRAVAIGRRKSSTAKIMLVPGTGEFRVNGTPLVDYFSRPRDVYAIAEPFQVTGQFGKFNVWAQVRSGGHTGIIV